MTDFTVSPIQAYTFENLEWDLTPPQGGFVRSGTLDVASLNAAQHYPNGYLLSGLVLAKDSVSNLLVPYLQAFDADAVTAGLQGQGHDIAIGLLRASVPIQRLLGGSNRAKIGVAVLAHGVVSASKLPYTVTNAASGGYLDDPARADLPLILWEA